MTNIKLLKQKINYEGLKLMVLSYKLGISRTTLWSRLNGTSEFTIDEIRDICRILRLDERERKEIFNISTERDYILKNRKKVGYLD